MTTAMCIVGMYSYTNQLRLQGDARMEINGYGSCAVTIELIIWRFLNVGADNCVLISGKTLHGRNQKIIKSWDQMLCTPGLFGEGGGKINEIGQIMAVSIGKRLDALRVMVN